MNHRQVTSLWCDVIIEELIRQGAGFFCISPGSRSTPLTLAVARNPASKYRIFPDERSAGFYALGHAKATGMPAVLICTSGTAVANYFPAVVEASADSRPMIILSADRPFELLESGANQTIRQENIFGTYTRWSLQLPSPGTGTPLVSLLSTVDHAVKISIGSPAGPVHLNVPLQEPLEPEQPDMEHQWAAPVRSWMDSSMPWSRFEIPEKEPSAEGIALLWSILAKSENPLFVAGNLDNIDDAQAVEALAVDLGIPLMADLTSGIRVSKQCKPWQLAFHSEAFIERFRPDTVIHFGGSMIGKQPAQAIRKWAPSNYVVVREHPARFSPDHNITMSIEATPGSVAMALAGHRQFRQTLEGTAFFSAARDAIETLASAPDLPVNEISAARIVSSLIDNDHALFVSNSMPARDMDMYAASIQTTPVHTALNRGVSGIDGIISTAAGFSAGLQRPVTLIIGDISFLHDLNALSLLSHALNQLVVIVLNNHGGGIFSFLPVASVTECFEECFATPQNFSIKSAAETFGLPWSNPLSNRNFAECYIAALQSGRSNVIEVSCSREENFQLHESLKASISACADQIQWL